MAAPGVLDRLAVLAGRSWSVSELPGGLTNVNLRVSTDDGDPHLDLVVRCWRGDAALLDIDREAEHLNTVAAARAGVGAPVVEFRPDLGMLVIGFLPGRALVDEDFTDAGVMRRAATAVRALHDGPRFTGDFDMFARRAGYLATIRERGFRLPDGYESYAERWDDVRRALAASPRRTVPCNNDACFELGNTAAECGFTPEMTDAWVESYFGTPTRADVARVRLQSLCSWYGWSLWGFIQAAASPLDFDFWSWGMERYDKAREAFADPVLEHLLEDVADG
jgi:thiamine kinase-like enzyme